MIESIGLAAAQFALEYAGGRWLDWRKRQRLASAYRESAEETIELCVQKGYPARSPVWESVTSLLGSEEKARQVAHWYIQHRISPSELQDMAKNDPVVGHFIKEFIVRLNDRRAILLPLDLANLADIISERVVLLLDEAKIGVPQPINRTTYWLGRPTSLAENFVGREAELDALAAAFGNCHVVVISGGAGTGKSRLAAEFSHQSKAEGFWTTAGTTLVQTLVALAPNLGVPLSAGKDAEVAEQVQRRLSQLIQEKQDTLLWVVDNVGDLSLVNELSAATGASRLLVTTRDSRSQLLPGTVAFVELQPLDVDPAVALLCSRRRGSGLDPKDPLLKELVRVVGGLPLALEMLAVRLGENRQTPQRIIDQLRRVPNPVQIEVFQQSPNGASVPRTEGVFTTISGTLETLSPAIREQISPLGYVANVPIPEDLLVALTTLGEEELDRLIRECSRQSILSWVDNQVVIHTLTVAALQATNGEDALPLTMTCYRIWDRLRRISQVNPVVLRMEIAHYEQILEHASNVLGPENAVVLGFSNNLANGYRSLGRYQEVLQLYEEILRIREWVRGPEHPDTLESRHNLAIGYYQLGRTAEAVQLGEETWRIYERVLGLEHPDTLASCNNLAVGCRSLGRYQEAVQLDEKTLATRERVLGPEHPDTLESRHNLANGYRAVGRNREADELESKVK